MICFERKGLAKDDYMLREPTQFHRLFDLQDRIVSLYTSLILSLSLKGFNCCER
jgi:hypothetical protein